MQRRNTDADVTDVRGVDAGEFKCSNPELTTSLVYHAADGLLHDIILGHRSMTKRDVVQTIQEFTDRALLVA